MANVAKKSNQVPYQYLGYSLQVQRALARLLTTEPCSFVSLEVFEDVGVILPGGEQLAEQGKSFHTSNPVSDHAVNLWKTLSNWIDNLESGLVDGEKTQFVIYTFQPFHGEIVDNFSSARSLNESIMALGEAKRKLWGDGLDYPLKNGVSESIRPYVNRVLGADQKLIAKIIMNFSLESGSGKTTDDLKELIKKKFVPDEVVDEVLLHCLGWVKEKYDTLIEQGQPAILSEEEFRRNSTAFLRLIDRRTVLYSLAKRPEQNEIDSALKEFKIYIQQLDLVDCDDDEKIRAVIDFMKAESDRTTWSVNGTVDEESFDDYEEGLVSTWEYTQKKVSIELGNRSDIDRGKATYYHCSLYRAKLEGIDLPEHFTRGSFHALADVERLGWHPNYLSLLKRKTSDE
jgi:hypothetical protein